GRHTRFSRDWSSDVCSSDLTLRADPDRLDACLRAFPSGARVAVEPRHPSWAVDEVRAVLERRGAALCWADRDGRPVTPLWRTAGDRKSVVEGKRGRAGGVRI